MSYLIMKLLHIIFVILFLGNIILGIFWKTYADKTKDKKIIAHTLNGMQKSGRLFGTPGIIGILIFGFAAQGIGGYPITTPWILWSIILFLFSGFAFGAKVGKLHKKCCCSQIQINLILMNIKRFHLNGRPGDLLL